MSYDLYFWKQTKQCPETPGEIIDLLSADEPVDGIAALPREHVREKFRRLFPNIIDGDFQLDWEGSGSYFRVGFAHADGKHVHLIIVNCGYQLLKSPDVINRIVTACRDLGCALFDPQTGKRHEQSDSK